MTFSAYDETSHIEFNLDEELRRLTGIPPIEEITFQPLNDFMLILSGWGKKPDGAEISYEQVKELVKGSSRLAHHKRTNHSILVLIDQYLQRLTLVVNKDRSVPHFCFMTS